MSRNEMIEMRWCHASGITIYPVPVGSSNGVYYIHINKKGTVTAGKNIYRDKPLKDEPSVWEKINDLYQEIYNKNHNSPKP